MPGRDLAERLGEVDAGLRGTERHVRQQLDEGVTGVRNLDADSMIGRRGRRVNGAPEATRELAHQTEHQVVAAGQREIHCHHGASLLQSLFAPATCSRRSSGLVQLAVKAKILSAQQLRDVQDLAVVHAEMFHHVIHSV